MDAKSISRADKKEITVASEVRVSLAIPPCHKKTQTSLHIKGKDVVFDWERALSFLTIDIKQLWGFVLNLITRVRLFGKEKNCIEKMKKIFEFLIPQCTLENHPSFYNNTWSAVH